MNLFFEGGPLFMSLLTLSLIASVYFGLKKNMELASQGALLALVLGVLGQLIGLYSAFEALSSMGGVDPKMLYGGLRVSMIPTLYGVLIYSGIKIWTISKSLKA
jgi:hypothetical protein